MNERIGRGGERISTREWYDFIGEMSGQLTAIHMGGEEATMRLLGLCEIKQTSRVLDVGCGSGYTACRIAKEYGAQVEGVDLSEAMIEAAEQRALSAGVSQDVKFRVADAFDLPFESNRFDAAIIESVLTPLAGDKRQAMREIIRVIRPGGWIAANESTLSPSSPPELLALVEEHPGIRGHFTPQTLRELFEDAGLSVVYLLEAKSEEMPSPLKALGLRGILAFMLRVYPKVVLKLLRDARFRRASRVDDQITKRYKQYMGYALIVGQKPA